MTWIDMARVAIAPTLDDETLRSRGLMKVAADADEGPRPKRQRARPHLGEPVTAATIYGRARSRQAEGGPRVYLPWLQWLPYELDYRPTLAAASTMTS
jgi:hypothetical protein